MKKNLHKQFPILQTFMNGKSLVYFDNGATTQKPKSVINAVVDFYSNYNSNVHRSLNPIAEKSTVEYEKARKKIAQFIGAKSREIIFTRGTTESLNLIAQSWGAANLKKGDRVVLTETEHHSNIIPWLQLKEFHGIEVDFIPVAKNGENAGELDYKKAQELIAQPNVKLVSFQLVSNTLGIIHRYYELLEMAQEVGAITVVDGAQAMAHMEVNVQNLNCDFLAFSAHKMYGPTGIGVLYGKTELLETMPAWHGGGEMIADVRRDGFDVKEIPHKFEAGTPNIAGAIGMGAAVDFINELGADDQFEAFTNHEYDLSGYLLEELNKLDFVTIYGTQDLDFKIPSVAFNIEGIHAHDVGELLGQQGIAVRSGRHCTQVLHDSLNIPATVRASLGVYNTVDEIDTFITVLKKIKKSFK